MKRACFLLAGWVGLTGSLTNQAAEFQVGAALVVINSPVGTPLAGYYSQRGGEGVLDDLLAKTLVVSDGKSRAAIVVCDLISMTREIVVEARRLIETETGIPGANVLIAATHSHTGPVLARESALDDLTGGSSVQGRAYTDQLPRLIANSVVQAHQRLTPALVSHASEHEDDLAFCRRFWMRDGTVGWNPGKLNAEIVRPVGSVDPEVGVVYFESPARKPLLTLVNYAMHPDTVGGTRLSADYPGAMARILAGYKGPDMLTLFTNGACGDLNHINVQWDGPQKGPEEAHRLGTILAAAVFKAYMRLTPLEDCTLSVKSSIVELPLAPITELEVAQAREIASNPAGAKFLEQVHAYKVLDVQARGGKPYEVEVQVIALGREIAWVSLPGEIFVDLGLSVKAASPFQLTQIVELANGAIGYIPHRSAYAEGNYEVISARCAAGSGEKLVTAAVTLLRELHTAAPRQE